MERQYLDRVMGITDITYTDLNDMPSWVRTYNDYLRWCHQTYKNDMPQTPTPTYDGHVGEIAVVIDKGRWIISCPACGSNYMVNKGETHFICASCQYTPGQFGSLPRRRGAQTPWQRILWPNNIIDIENEILQQPGMCERSPYRDWQPSWTLGDLKARTILAWQMVENDPNATGLSISSTRLWAVGETVTAANVIRYINNPINDIAGRRNPPTQFEDSIEVLDGAGNRYILLPRGTTSQRPAIPKVGMTRYNISIPGPEVCTSVSPITWVSMVGGTISIAPGVGGNVDIDYNVTHGQQISDWDNARSRVVLGHDLGKPSRGYQLSLVMRTSVGDYDSGDEVFIPHAAYVSNSNWYKTNLSSTDSNTTVVMQILTSSSGLSVPVLNRDDSGSVLNITESQAYMRISLWG